MRLYEPEVFLKGSPRNATEKVSLQGEELDGCGNGRREGVSACTRLGPFSNEAC